MEEWEKALISEDTFIETWGACIRSDGSMLAFDDVRGQPLNHVWTITDSCGGRPDHWIASPGFHVVNVLGYAMTRKPWDDKTPDAFFSFDDFDGDDAEEVDQ